MQKKIDRAILIIYLMGFLILALSIGWTQPLADTPPLYGNPPDEHARYLVPKYICEHGALPTGFEEEVRIPAYGFSYALYNAFPYIVQGCVMRLVKLFTAVPEVLLCAARTVNVVFGMLMAMVVYLLSKRLFADRRFRWLFCFGIMYLPQNLFLHTYVNTDSCCLLATAMMVYAMVMSYEEGYTFKSNLWMSGGIILCALSYYNAYGYILSCILLLLGYFTEKKNGKFFYNYGGMLKNGLLISTVVLLGIGWWFIRSYIVLDGDILGLRTRDIMAGQYAIEEVNPLYTQSYQEKGYSVWEMMEERHTVDGTFSSFVATYGSMSIYGSPWLYRGYKVLFAAGFAGCLYCFLGKLMRWGRSGNRMQGKRIFLHANLIFCICMPVFLMVYYAYTTDYQNQGRYVMPALVPLMYYTVKGVEKLSNLRWRTCKVPEWLVNVGVLTCFTLMIAGTIHMVYVIAMPIYLELGMVL